MKITILGCGSSAGVPTITGDWGICESHNLWNRRRRASVLVEYHGFNILIDTSPDLREQLLEAKVSHIDAVLYTHHHADHIYGLPDLRPFLYKQKGPIPLYADPVTMLELEKVFDYAFKTQDPLYHPFVTGHEIKGPFDLFGLTIIPFAQDHGAISTWGFRIGNFAYSTDFKTIPTESLNVLKGLDLWIVDCLRFEEHPTHSHFDNTVAMIEKIKPKHAVFTHMSPQMDYDVALSACGLGVEPGRDGMVIRLEDISTGERK